MLSGALAAGLAIPFAGLAGFTTEKTETLQDLPQQFDEVPLKQKSTILAADGSLIATLAEQNRVPVKLSQVAPIMQKAMVAIEDDRFYEHGALDLKGTLRAQLLRPVRGRRAAGWLEHHPAVREDEPGREGEHARRGRRRDRRDVPAQGRRAALRDRGREGVLEERDPREVPEPGQLR